MSKQNNIIILLDGEASAEPWISDFSQNAYVIAADGGIRHAALFNIEPHLWVGDFDSSDSEMQVRYKNVPLKEYPPDKVKSDGELAIEEALALSPQMLVIVGALGGCRTDHSFFNVLNAVRFAHKHPDTKFILTGDGEFAMPLLPKKPLRIARSLGTTLSIVPFSDLNGLSIEGVYWPLKLVDVEFGSTHTLSNRIVSDAEVQLIDGLAIAIVQTNG